ncbi:TPA: hypothetical protein OCO99_004583 [Escherichia coli]|nr:hypothetical protein [Escherichia coli]
MNSFPIEQGEQLRVGTVDFVSPNEIRALLDIDSPDSVALNAGTPREGANKQVISSQADSLIKISRIWADFFPVNTSNQPI